MLARSPPCRTVGQRPGVARRADRRRPAARGPAAGRSGKPGCARRETDTGAAHRDRPRRRGLGARVRRREAGQRRPQARAWRRERRSAIRLKQPGADRAPIAVRVGLTHQQTPSTATAIATIARRARMRCGPGAARDAGTAAWKRPTASSSAIDRGPCVSGGWPRSRHPSRRATSATMGSSSSVIVGCGHLTGFSAAGRAT